MRGKHTAKTVQVGSILSAPGGGAIVLASASNSASALHSPLAPLGMVCTTGVQQVQLCASLLRMSGGGTLHVRVKWRPSSHQ
jgi:hypothetical protein